MSKALLSLRITRVIYFRTSADSFCMNLYILHKHLQSIDYSLN